MLNDMGTPLRDFQSPAAIYRPDRAFKSAGFEIARAARSIASLAG
jgi:hypothetical protein